MPPLKKEERGKCVHGKEKELSPIFRSLETSYAKPLGEKSLPKRKGVIPDQGRGFHIARTKQKKLEGEGEGREIKRVLLTPITLVWNTETKTAVTFGLESGEGLHSKLEDLEEL